MAQQAIGTIETKGTISAIEARDPPISGLPVRTTAEPSSLTLTVALDCMPALNQKPLAIPRPWFSPSCAL